MKFTIVIVILAMGLAADASIHSGSPHHHPEWSAWGNGMWGHYGGDSHHAGWDDGHWSHGPSHTHGISLSQHGHGWDGHHYGHNAHIDIHHGHHDHHHDGHYVAKTLGAVHTAPLPGHIASVKSINVAAPPGGH